jgi:hypothetical protein
MKKIAANLARWSTAWACLFWIWSTAAGAQADSTAFQPVMQVGVQGGRSWNQINFSPPVEQDFQQGYTLALAFSYRSERHAGIQFALGYDSRGWREPPDTLANPYIRRVSYGYLHMQTRITVSRWAVRPLFQIGPYLAVPLSDREEIPAGTGEMPFYYGQPLPRRLEYGLQGGLGATAMIGGLEWQLAGHFRYGFSHMFEPGAATFNFSQPFGIVVQSAVFFSL